MVNPQQLIEFSSYFSIIHHIKGRIRVRVSPKIKELNTKNISINDIENLTQTIRGIKHIKVNKIVGSVTIEYDAEIFPDHLWVDLIQQNNLEEIATLINQLSKEMN
ncbi:MAG: HMA2 domain-containing protein [Sulfurimonadaceae bacterium]|nr:hypothetical protein [Arcobacteraceae bacterium]